ncbi:hypothetical protein [Jiangella sp. DSM 45060]|uniref:hypothetical protein n=1 Tax=Jiangella sp. DSM 45060 TaxID=1798224 RepID=UPI000B89AD78|nr:hypothetical protein [Jiangella sp. DSM 45060]
MAGDETTEVPAILSKLFAVVLRSNYGGSQQVRWSAPVPSVAPAAGSTGGVLTAAARLADMR